MATIVTAPGRTPGTSTKHLRLHIGAVLTGTGKEKKMNIGLTKLPDLYHSTLIAKVDAFMALLRNNVRIGRSPSGVDYTATIQKFIRNQITDMLLESLGMSDMAVTFNDEVIHVPATVVQVPVVEVPKQVSKATGVPTVKEAYEEWIESAVASSLATATVNAYKSRMGNMVLCIGEDTPINELTYQHLKDTLWNPEVPVSLHGKKASGQGVIISVLKNFIKWCMEVYPTAFPINYKNPASVLRPQAATEKVDKETGRIIRTVTRASEQRDAFTEEEVKAIMGALKGKNAMEWFIMASFLTGARINELAQLHKEDVTIDDETGLVSIRIARTFPDQSLKNAASERTIPLGFPDKETARAFYEFSQSQTTEAFFGFPFSVSRNSYKPNLSLKWRTAVEKLGVLEGGLNGKSQHSCRHTIATFLKKCDVREDVAKQFIGHSNEANMTTGRYGKPYTPEELYSRLKDAGVYNNYY